jgi:glycosyltransferase involved in cell wall biosynthesis
LKLLLIAPVFPPQRSVASLRTHAFATAWAAAGHDVTVLTTKKRLDQTGLNLPVHRFRVVELDYAGPRLFEWLRRRSRAAATDAAPSPRSRPRLPARVARWFKERTGVFSFVRQPDLTDAWVGPAVAWARANGPWDVAYSSFGPPAALIAGVELKGRGHVRKWAAEFRDLWLDNDPYGGLFPFTLAERRRERRALAAADLLVTVSPGLARRLEQKSGKPVEVVYNGYDPAGLAAVTPEPAFPPDDRLRLVHTGTIYTQRQDPRSLLMALRTEPRATLVVAGSQKADWDEWGQRYGVSHQLDVRGELPRGEALRLQRDASVLVLFGWGTQPNGVLPGKCFEYLKAAAPVWVIGGSPKSSAAEVVVRASRGIHVPNDVTEIGRRLKEAVERPPMLKADETFIAGLNREEQSRRVLHILERL